MQLEAEGKDGCTNRACPAAGERRHRDPPLFSAWIRSSGDSLSRDFDKLTDLRWRQAPALISIIINTQSRGVPASHYIGVVERKLVASVHAQTGSSIPHSCGTGTLGDSSEGLEMD